MGAVLALGDWSPPAQAFASRLDRVRHAFGGDLCVDLGSASESADESESVLPRARLAVTRTASAGFSLGHCTILTVVLLTVTVIGVEIRSCCVGEPSEEHFVKKMKRSDRSEYRTLSHHLQMCLLYANEFQEGFNMCWIDHTSDSNHPREDVDYPTLLSVVAEGLFQEDVCLLFALSSCLQLRGPDIGGAAKVRDGNPLKFI